jgi:hypothetical protein
VLTGRPVLACGSTFDILEDQPVSLVSSSIPIESISWCCLLRAAKMGLVYEFGSSNLFFNSPSTALSRFP